jgi:hypothetical protein
MLQRCRESIERHAPPGEKANLLVVTQVFSFLRYNDLGLLTILGGKNVMLEIPFLDEIVMEKTRETARETARERPVFRSSTTRRAACVQQEERDHTGLAGKRTPTWMSSPTTLACLNAVSGKALVGSRAMQGKRISGKGINTQGRKMGTRNKPKT